ncbi:TetR/AcrR family transcriptional regulator [Mucilaginibacter aquariorum]|uniref:TetR/AcrR family transcriptional regulator n=1 Tax=Mucilaginibacter aquariorum TaxID=2967225 RepID=A0ABT1SVH0_9SPHI|nr:TetR/AcrR family transcriptional regulator [Mucilaginibacter aquariorum]MCQ6956343.1 TetR/AcrR family transcriptional regulator [Mucilaginibacter aquariorum]
MMAVINEQLTKENLSTEEKLKEAARIVFTKKGYAATKTRDIADEAGLNLALFHYYFRSKEKLFEIIMMEKVQQLFSFIAPALNNPDNTLEEKIDWITANYIDMLLKNPDLPIFVLSEIRNNPERFGKTVQLNTYVLKSHFVKQLAERKKDINPIQLFLSFLGMMVFPFISKPIFETTGAVNEAAFKQLMDERKLLIPKWIKMMLE